MPIIYILFTKRKWKFNKIALHGLIEESNRLIVVLIWNNKLKYTIYNIKIYYLYFICIWNLAIVS